MEQSNLACLNSVRGTVTEKAVTLVTPIWTLEWLWLETTGPGDNKRQHAHISSQARSGALNTQGNKKETSALLSHT